jgi:hypothetical protein
MLTVERPRRAVLLLLLVLVLALAPAAALTQAWEPTLVRLSDAIGDTLDLAERDSLHLFPNTAGFQHAVIVALPGPEFYAKVMLATPNTLRHVFFRLMPGDLQRIRFLVSNSGYVSEQQQSDSTTAKTLASFWQEIEEHPLRSIAGEPADTTAVQSPPLESTAVASVPSANGENRYIYSLHGTTCGSIAGGCIGSWSGITYVRTEQPTGCGPTIDVYRFDPCIFWGASCGFTALAAGAGYTMGDRLDREHAGQMSRLKEGTGWRKGVALGALVPGVALGYYSFLALGVTMYGRLTEPFIRIEPDPGAVALLPAAVTGLCIALESATLGYQIGRAIDRRKAEEAEARRLAPRR